MCAAGNRPNSEKAIKEAKCQFCESTARSQGPTQKPNFRLHPRHFVITTRSKVGPSGGEVSENYIAITEEANEKSKSERK